MVLVESLKEGSGFTVITASFLKNAKHGGLELVLHPKG